MSLLTVANRSLVYLKLGIYQAKLNVLSAMEYRTSFIMQVVGMMINNCAFIVLWYIYFNKFPNVNGWGFKETMLLFSVGTVNFGLALTFGGGALEIAKIITYGGLDHYLLLPKNLIYQLVLSKSRISAIGDAIFGYIVYFVFCDVSLESFLVLNLVSVISALAFINFTVITQALVFFLPGFTEGANAFWEQLLTFSIYPSSTFHGALKVVMLTVVPGFFIYTLPVELVRSFSLAGLLTLIAFWMISQILVVLVFRVGLKRYESGSLIQSLG